MVFSAVGYTNTTTGNVLRPPNDEKPEPIVDAQGYPHYKSQLLDKHDPVQYTLVNAPLISLAGLVSGFQEAFYRFDKMPPPVSRQTLRQAMSLYGIVGKRTLFAGMVGAVFCYTDAVLENANGKSMTNGMAAAAFAGLAFGGYRPMPQPIAWPIMFALTAASADIVAEVIPKNLAGFKAYGPIEGRENWGDPKPPRPPIMDTSAAVRPQHGGHFWRGN